LDAGIFSSHSPERDPPSHEAGEEQDVVQHAVKAADAAVNPQASLSA